MYSSLSHFWVISSGLQHFQKKVFFDFSFRYSFCFIILVFLFRDSYKLCVLSALPRLFYISLKSLLSLSFHFNIFYFLFIYLLFILILIVDFACYYFFCSSVFLKLSFFNSISALIVLCLLKTLPQISFK
jgi:hypothetical protein